MGATLIFSYLLSHLHSSDFGYHSTYSENKKFKINFVQVLEASMSLDLKDSDLRDLEFS